MPEYLKCLSDNERLLVEQTSRAFEDAWQAGFDSPPEIPSYLPANDPLRFAVLAELVAIDLTRRLQRVRETRIEGYLGRFPELANDREAMLALIVAESEKRRQHDPAGVSLQEYQRRFPSLGEDLQLLLLSDLPPSAAPGIGTKGNNQPSSQPALDAGDAADRRPPTLSLRQRLAGMMGQLIGVSNEGSGAAPRTSDLSNKGLIREGGGPAADVTEMQTGDEVSDEGKISPSQLTPPEESDRTPDPPLPKGAPAELPPNPPVIEGYQILEELGRGGMGQVFKARHVRLDRLVALKIVRQDRLGHPDAVRRFQREAKAAARLAHPNIVTLFDADQFENLHFLVMEFVEGINLGRLVRDKGTLPVAQACEYVRQACLGLQHAHERGLVHRDIKPSNLILTPQGIVKILDLGLVRMAPLSGDDLCSDELTAVGMVMGTPDYLAPEQAADARMVDIRADIYSLGCTLYFLITGHPPFPDCSFPAKLIKHAMHDPTPVTSSRPEIGSPMQSVLSRLMAKRPEDRYQTPAEAAAALEPFTPTALARPLPGTSGKPTGSALGGGQTPVEEMPNPFFWRSGIIDVDGFFNREREQRTLRAYVHGRQNCQIVGPRRIGKTSVLRQVQRRADEWVPRAVVAYVDLHDPRCYSSAGFLAQVSRQFGAPSPVRDLAEFADLVETMLAEKRRPVLCLDEFEVVTVRGQDFPRDFFLTLRSCGQKGLSIITTSQKRLSELTDASDPTSPYYNTFACLSLGPFTREDAADFVSCYRPGLPAFAPAEKEAILEFARSHPLALQVACFHVVQAKENGESLASALRNAEADLKADLRSW
jgi:serine/threonine protein kinase